MTDKDFYKRPHVYVATPAYDGKVETDYAMSLANASWHAGVFGYQVTASVMANGAFIDLARNMFMKFFLEDQKECTHILFIDSDLKFEVRAFIEVIRHCTEDRPVIAGAYRRRNEIEDYPVRWTPHPEKSKDGIDKLWFDDDGFLMCNRVPTGFLCIRRNIVEEMFEDTQKMILKGHGEVPKFFYTYIDENSRFVGEDFAWCDDYTKKYGNQISVWTDFDFVHGGYKGNYQKWIEKNSVGFDEDLKPTKGRRTLKKRSEDRSAA